MLQASAERALSGWGRYPVRNCRVARVESPADMQLSLGAQAPAIARGNGRSYGDASLCEHLTLDTRPMDRLRAFDAQTGLVECEAGLLLSDLLDFLVPRGWFPPVTPGTQFVTVGGMIASDVHGKNHHGVGSFAMHVQHLDLALGDGSVLRCSPTQHADLFWATCGGMGLTGVIVAASFRAIPIESARVVQRLQRAADLREAIALLDAADSATYSVAWIDCLATGAALGRSVVMLGEHATRAQLPAQDQPRALQRPVRPAKSLPFDLPAFALNGLSVRLFNGLYYRAQKPGESLVDLQPYFYPLDALQHWNRMYGARGFLQYQCALPTAVGPDALRSLLQAIGAAGIGSFLAVLKKFGNGNPGYLSFPMPGYTLALDFPASADALALLQRLDPIVQAAGGRLYLAKDARGPRSLYETGYPQWDAFKQLRRSYGLDRRFRSALSERLGL